MKKAELKNIGVLITRPNNQNQELNSAIKNHGGNSILFPVINIKPFSYTTIKSNKEQLKLASIVIFVSVNAAINGANHFDFTDTKVIAIGPSTKDYLEKNNITVSYYPKEGYNSEKLLQHAMLSNVKNQIITIIRGEAGRRILGDELSRRGLEVQYLETYKREQQRHTKEEITCLKKNFRDGIIHFIVIMGFETFEYLSIILNSNHIKLQNSIKFVVPSQRIADKIHACSKNNTCIISPDTQILSIIDAIQKNRLV